MLSALKENMPYSASALAVLAVFYGIYFAKMAMQGRRGIRTDQIGRRKEKGLHMVELLMKAATLIAPASQLISVLSGWSCINGRPRIIGFAIGVAGDLVFLISVITMKDSWRAGIPDKDKTELVTSGIYRYSRNPAFLGFDLQYIGVLILCFNPLTAASSLFAMVMLHLQILQEERYLEHEFGTQYSEYRSHVLRYFGRH